MLATIIANCSIPERPSDGRTIISVLVSRRSGGSFKNQIALAVLCQFKVFAGIGELARVVFYSLDYNGIFRCTATKRNRNPVSRIDTAIVVRHKDFIFRRRKIQR